MAALLTPKEPDVDDEDNNVGSDLNSPEIDESGKPTQRAISSAKQAHSIAKNLYNNAKDNRIVTAGIIAKKYNGDPPFNSSDLAKLGQTWRNNFSTNWLASIIDRVKPQLLDPMSKADILTHSSLPATVENAGAKSRKFCEVTTKTIRCWPNWKDFMSQLAQELVLYGIATPGWIDLDWRPRLWKFDEVFAPDATGQHASDVQVMVFTQKMLLHKFMQLFKDQKIAKKAGYEVQNCIVAANKAAGERSNDDETDLERANREREGKAFEASYASEAKTVNLYHVLVTDYTGEVDLWTVTQDDGLEIRSVEGLHPDGMEDGTTLFTFQSGNGTLYGSKGLGRMLTNLHIAIERGRCLGADQMYLSGLVILKSDKKDAAALQAKVRHPFIFIDAGIEVVTEQIQFQSEAFELMDQKLNQIGDSIAGAFIPPNLDQGGSPNTKIEAAQNAERELAVKEGVLGRFFDHAGDLISAMQRKIYSDVNLREGKRAYDSKIEKEAKGIMVLARKVWKLLTSAFGKDKKIASETPEDNVGDEEAVSAVVELLEAGLTVEDIATLALSPSHQTAQNEGAEKDLKTLTFITNNKTNPFIDQKKATQMEARLTVGEDRADILVLPDEDPQVEAIATRQQLMECTDMMMGIPLPAAESDHHEIHKKILGSKLEEIMPAVDSAPTQEILGVAELLVSHFVEHIQKDSMLPPEQAKQEAEAMKGLWANIQKQKEGLAKVAQEAAQAGVQTGPDGLPVPVQGQPPQVGPDGAIMGEQTPEQQKLQLDAYKVGQRDREIALKEDQHTHQKTVDALDITQNNLKAVQDAAKATGEQSRADADLELQQMSQEIEKKALPGT